VGVALPTELRPLDVRAGERLDVLGLAQLLDADQEAAERGAGVR
jgi:hypothetical protein